MTKVILLIFIRTFYGGNLFVAYVVIKKCSKKIDIQTKTDKINSNFVAYLITIKLYTMSKENIEFSDAKALGLNEEEFEKIKKKTQVWLI